MVWNFQERQALLEILARLFVTKDGSSWVENTLFRLPQDPFMASPVFVTMFTCPPTEEGPQGVSEDRPINLGGISAYEFEQLVWVLNTGIFEQDCFTIRSFEAILRLSTMWEFDSVRDYAIRTITMWRDEVSPATLIRLGLSYGVSDWLIPAYTQLCIRITSVSLEEGLELGMRVTVGLGKLRESIRCCAYFQSKVDTRFHGQGSCGHVAHSLTPDAFREYVEKQVRNSDLPLDGVIIAKLTLSDLSVRTETSDKMNDPTSTSTGAGTGPTFADSKDTKVATQSGVIESQLDPVDSSKLELLGMWVPTSLAG
ncbi:hypothetical protein FRB96_001032 [Tulasnella sp. 330]|nr:hypothetical protein FRB96_001032 [Tulasnella sp. 330]